MKAVLVLLAAAASVVSAQSNSSLIPTNITSSCSAFLTKLNADTSIQTCVTPLINATNSFSPTSDTSANISSSDVNSTLSSLCTSTGCSDKVVRQWLSSFYSNCSAELTSATGYNSRVRELYDVLYVVNPLRGAVCAIDSSNQDYCVKRISSAFNAASSANSSSSAAASATGSTNATAGNSSALFASFAATDNVVSPLEVAANNLYIALSVPVSTLSKRVLNILTNRQSNSDAQQTFTSIVTPNTTTYRNTNLPFLFLQPSMTNSQLCTPCTREIMVAYIKWEVAYPYALGLSQSPILGGQSDLWSAINKTCGSVYVNAITSEVGISAATLNFTSSAVPAAKWASGGGVAVAVLAGAVALLA